MGIFDPIVRRSNVDTESRSVTSASFGFNGHTYPIIGFSGANPDIPDATFRGYVESIHKRNGVVAAAVEARALLLSQLRFRWRRTAGNVGELWGNRDLTPLERPGSMTRPELLHQLEIDASYSGTGYVVRDGNMLRRLRPDRVTVALGSDSDPEWDGEQAVIPYDAKVMGLIYHPHEGGWRGGAQVFMPGDFACWKPEPDPINFWRGQSWVSSVLSEIITDGQATEHTSKFFEHAAVPNLVFIMDPSKSAEETRKYADVVNEVHAGSSNHYRNMFLGGGTDVKTIGSTLENLNLKDLQGGLENRVAIRSRVPAVLLGAREGLSGSSLNAGNYGSARRMFADGWFSPTADNLCAALEAIVPPPGGSELGHDPTRILFLQEDVQDQASVMATNATAMRTLVDAGFDPPSVIQAINTGDMTKLIHTGKLSVQLQEPGENEGTPTDDDDG